MILQNAEFNREYHGTFETSNTHTCTWRMCDIVIIRYIWRLHSWSKTMLWNYLLVDQFIATDCGPSSTVGCMAEFQIQFVHPRNGLWISCNNVRWNYSTSPVNYMLHALSRREVLLVLEEVMVQANYTFRNATMYSPFTLRYCSQAYSGTYW